MNLAILASGNGTNFEAIAKAVKKGYIKARLKILISDKKEALVNNRAKKFGIKNIFIDPKAYPSREEFDKEILKILKQEKINLVVLAGFMRILSPGFVQKLKNKIINIHPSLLPSFKGTQAIARAFKYGCKVTGVTVHFVDECPDHGPIIRQETITITPEMDLKKLEDKIHRVEHKLYPLVIKLLAEKKLRIKGRNVVFV